MATWALSESGNLVLELSTGTTASAGATSSVEAEVWFVLRLGPHRETWTQGPYTLSAGSTVQVTPTVPDASTVHELALTHGADLYGLATVGEYSGRLDTVFVTWPDGGTSPAEISATISADQGFDLDILSTTAAEEVENYLATGSRLLPAMGHSHRGREDTGGDYYYHGLDADPELEE